MAGTATNALSNGQSQALASLGGTAGTTWRNFTASWTCSATTDNAANAWLEGSADGGTTWFPLVSQISTLPSQSPTGTGARFYADQPVNAVMAFVTCSPGNTVTVTVTGE